MRRSDALPGRRGGFLGSRFQRVWPFVLALWIGGCHHREALPLPAETDMAPDRLMIFVHGYLAEADAMAAFIQAFSRVGIDAERIGGTSGAGRIRYHVHSFDFGAFTQAGSDHNISVQLLAERFLDFYHHLPETCPICRRRASRPVRVTLVGHSFGGIVVREFLLRELSTRYTAALPPAAFVVRPGLGASQSAASSKGVANQGGVAEAWRIDRVVTTGTPFFGSVRTRLTYGFLSVLINGVLRTAVMGFVAPVVGSVYGAVVDEQARTLRFGSPYLWESHDRWRRLVRRLRATGQSPPRWLVCISVGKALAQIRGDGVTRFASGNVPPLLPDEGMETFLSSVPHQQMVRLKDKPWKAREQALLIHAVARFQATGTLEDDPLLAPYRIVTGPDGARFEPDAGPPRPPERVLQRLFVQRVGPADLLGAEDFERKARRLQRILRADQADVWFFFHDGLPDGSVGWPPPLMSLRSTLTLFQNRPQATRDRAELMTRNELNADGLSIPVVYGLARPRSRLVAIPDVTPTGVYRLYIRLGKGVVLSPEDVVVVNEGVPSPPGPVPGGDCRAARVSIVPYRTNLVHIYLNRARILAEHPELKRLTVRELAMDWEGDQAGPGVPVSCRAFSPSQLAGGRASCRRRVEVEYRDAVSIGEDQRGAVRVAEEEL